MKGMIDERGVLRIYRNGKPVRQDCSNKDGNHQYCCTQCVFFGEPKVLVDNNIGIDLCMDEFVEFDDFERMD